MKILQKVIRFLVIGLAGAITLLLAISFLIQAPPIQNFVVRTAVNWIDGELGTEVYLRHIDFALPGRAVLRDLVIYDEKDCEMIAMQQLRIDLLDVSILRTILSPGQPVIGAGRVELIEPQFNLYRDRDSVVNLSFLIDRFSKRDTTREKKPLPIELAVEEIELENGRFTWSDSVHRQFDAFSKGDVNFYRVAVRQLNLNTSLDIAQDHFSAEIAHLSFLEEHSGFFLDHLSGNIHDALEEDSTRLVRFENVQVQAQQTRLDADAYFPQTTLFAIFDQDPSETYYGTLRPTRIDFSTIDYFVPGEFPLAGVATARGEVGGRFDSIGVVGMEIEYGEATNLRGKVSIDQFYKPDDSWMEIDLLESTFSGRDLLDLLPETGMPEFFRQFRNIRLDGEYAGSYFDFDVDVSVRTNIGGLDAKTHLSVPRGGRPFAYDGKIRTYDFNISELQGDTTLQNTRINFDGEIIGKGTNLDELDARFDAAIVNSVVRGYTIDSAVVDVWVTNRRVRGNAVGTDGKGFADVLIDLDFNKDPSSYLVEGSLRDFDLERYGLYKEPLEVTSNLLVNLTGDSLDNVVGNIHLLRSRFHRVEDHFYLRIPDLMITSEIDEKGRHQARITGDLVQAEIETDMDYTKAFAKAGQFVKEAQLFLSNNDSLIADYYAQKVPDSVDVYFNLDGASGDSLNQLLSFFDIPVWVSPSSSFGLHFDFSQIDQFDLTYRSSDTRLQGRNFLDMDVNLGLTKYSDRNTVLLAGGLYADSAEVNPGFWTRNASIDIQGLDKEFETDLILEQPWNESSLQMKVVSEFMRGNKVVNRIDSAYSMLVTLGDTLDFGPDVEITVLEDEVWLDNFFISDGNRYIRLDGELSQDPESRLNVQVAGLNLGLINDFTDLEYQLGGDFNLDLDVTSALKNPKLSGLGRIDEFKLDDFDYGHVFLKSSWSRSQDRINLRANLLDGLDTTLLLVGYYDIADEEAPVNFQLLTEKGFPLDYAFPFVKDQIYGIEGTVELSEFNITGKLGNLQIQGTGHFDDARFGITFFQTEYRFTGDINFSKEGIQFPSIRLYDVNNNYADLYGWIFHDGLKDFEFDLQLQEMNDLLVLNTTEKDNELFYGKVYAADGLASVSGTLEQLDIQTFITTGPNSKLSIPVSSYLASDRPNYVSFVGDESGLGKVKTGIEGFDLLLTVNATPEAEVEIIFDKQVGDIIKGRGEGTISVEIDQEGNFNMFGDYTIERGEYLFTAQNVVNKKFRIKEGGEITFVGDPFETQIDLDAVYSLRASISDLLEDGESTRIPVDVLLHMEGVLLQPEIELSIGLPKVNEATAYGLATYIRTIQYDEQELNRQVFSLMVFNRFAPISTASVDFDVAAGVTTSVSELLSNQLNYWLSQAISDDVSVNVGTDNFQDVNLLVSARLFNDRVTLERDGTVVGDNSSFSIGNISVIIKLLPADKPGQAPTQHRSELVLEVFTRESYEGFQSAESITQQTGAGFVYRKDFNNLREFFQGKKKRKAQNQAPPSAPQDSLNDEQALRP